MKKISKVLSFVLIMVMAFGMIPTTAFAASAPSSWAVASVEEAKTLGLATPELLKDYTAPTTRLEFCRAAVNLLRQYGYDVDSTTPKMFADTDDRDVGIAAALGITSGTDTEKNLFSPNNALTREQAATLLCNTLAVLNLRKTGATVAWTDAASISSWAVQSASDMYNTEIIGGTSTTQLVFSPKGSYTHEQSIVTLLRLWTYISSDSGTNDPSQPSGAEDTYDSSEFEAGNLRDTEGEAVVLNEDVLEISAPAGENVLVSFDEANRRYTFSNINDDIKKLKTGDKFVIMPCESVPDGVAIIVSAIDINGSNAVITSTEVTLGDIVESMDVAEVVPMTTDMIIDYGEGVTPASGQGSMSGLSNSGIGANTLQRMSAISSGAYIPGSKLVPTGSASVKPLELSLNIPINSSVKVVGSISIATTIKADIDLKKGWFGIPTGVKYFEVSLDNKMTASLGVEALYNGQIVDMASVYRYQDGAFKQKYENFSKTRAQCSEYTQKLFTSKFPIATVPGLAVTVTWFIKVTASGSISIKAVYTQNNTLGIKYQNNNWSPINTSSSKMEVKGAANASIYAGVGIDLGLSYIGVVAATVSPEIGLEIAASTDFNATLLDTAAADKKDVDPHCCVLCIDGDINLKLSLGAKATFLGFNVLNKTLLSNKTKLGDFYITFGGCSHGLEFGWKECPYLNCITEKDKEDEADDADGDGKTDDKDGDKSNGDDYDFDPSKPNTEVEDSKGGDFDIIVPDFKSAA